MTETSISTSTASITCLCGNISEPGTLLTASTFPIDCGLCCCSACRYTSGALGGTGVPLRRPPSDKTLSACTKYQSGADFARYFCASCGSKLFWHGLFGHDDEGRRREEWEVTVGAVERADGREREVDTIKVRRCTYLESWRDGGLARRMVDVAMQSARGIEFHAMGSDDSKMLSSDEIAQLWAGSVEIPASAGSEQTTNVPLSCQCGAVQLRISSPQNMRSKADPRHIERWTREDCSKYVAKICVCRSDRLWFGTPMAVWTYVFPNNILTKDGTAIDLSFDRGSTPELPALKTFASSPDVRRSFCGCCGAGVFFERRNRPWIVNVAPGLLRADNGSMAEELLSWDWQWVSWPEENQNKEYLDMLTGGAIVMR